jgi:hypothetical protein
MAELQPQDDEADDETIAEALERVKGRDDAHAKLIRAMAGRVYVEHRDRMHWKERAEMLQMEHKRLGQIIGSEIFQSSLRVKP